MIFVGHGFSINMKTSSPVRLMTSVLSGYAQADKSAISFAYKTFFGCIT